MYKINQTVTTDNDKNYLTKTKQILNDKNSYKTVNSTKHHIQLNERHKQTHTNT